MHCQIFPLFIDRSFNQRAYFSCSIFRGIRSLLMWFESSSVQDSPGGSQHNIKMPLRKLTGLKSFPVTPPSASYFSLSFAHQISHITSRPTYDRQSYSLHSFSSFLTRCRIRNLKFCTMKLYYLPRPVIWGITYRRAPPKKGLHQPQWS